MKLVQTIQAYLSKQKTRKELANLPQHLWQDIGLTEQQIQEKKKKSSLSNTLQKLNLVSPNKLFIKKKYALAGKRAQ